MPRIFLNTKITAAFLTLAISSCVADKESNQAQILSHEEYKDRIFFHENKRVILTGYLMSFGGGFRLNETFISVEELKPGQRFIWVDDSSIYRFISYDLERTDYRCSGKKVQIEGYSGSVLEGLQGINKIESILEVRDDVVVRTCYPRVFIQISLLSKIGSLKAIDSVE